MRQSLHVAQHTRARQSFSLFVMKNSLRKFLIQREAASDETLSIFHQICEQQQESRKGSTKILSACLRNVV